MENDSGLEKLKDRLYKKETKIEERVERERLDPTEKGVKTTWEEPKKGPKEEVLQKMPEPTKKKKSSSIFWSIFFVFILFVVAGVGFLYYFVGFPGLGANIVSSRNIDLSIEGPLIVESGERNKWYVSVTNNNEANLELADLIIEYPEGALSLQNEEIEKERRALGEIVSGETVNEEVGFFVLGKEEEEKDIEITLEYRLADSNAIFAKEAKQTVKLSRSPVGVSVSLPKEIGSGQEFVVEVECVSNSESLLKDLYLRLDYPPGFEFLSSNLSPYKGKDLWYVGDLMPQERRTFEITGELEGQDLMELTFHGSVGTLGKNDELAILDTMSGSVVLKKSVFGLAFLVGGKDISYVSAGSQLNFSIPWQNNSPVEIRNATISVELLEDLINTNTISAKKGFYRGFDDTIVWNSSGLSELKSIAPGQSGMVEFSFSVKESLPIVSFTDKNFVFSLNGEMTGSKTEEDGEVVTVKSDILKEIKINSEIELVADLSLSSGSTPPKVDKENVYVVSWSISNLYNDVSGGVVRASLPSYVNWVGSVSPSGEDVAYNSATGEIIWNVGGLDAGVGLSSPVKKVTFQISFIPSVNQLNNSAELVAGASFEGRDNFTGATLRDLAKVLTTGSTEEAIANSSLGVIVQ